jgi:hypothetical protein
MHIVVGEDRVVLRVDRARRWICPFSLAGLTVGYGSQRKLNEKNRDVYLIDYDGDIRKIHSIKIVGSLSATFLGRLFQLLSGTRRIAVTLSEKLDWDLDYVKSVIVECINANGGLHDEDDDPPDLSRDQLIERILVARSVRDVLELLQLGPPEDALDSL